MTRLEALKELAQKVEAGVLYRQLDTRPLAADGKVQDTQSVNGWKAYHGSLDAALALHEAVLPGWEYGATRNPEQPRGPCAYVAPWGAADNDPLFKHAAADTPARAWLLSILKALIAQEEAQ